MLRLDRGLLLELAGRIEDNHDVWALSETSKAWHDITSQVMLPDQVNLEGPAEMRLSFAHLQQLRRLAKQLHRVIALKLTSVAHLQSDFFYNATALHSLEISNCTLSDLPDLPPKLEAFVLLDSAVYHIPPDLFTNATSLVSLSLDSVEGLKDIPVLSPNLAALMLRGLRDLTCQLPQLPSHLKVLNVSNCALGDQVPRQVPSSLKALCWHTTGDVDLGPSLEPYTHLQSLVLSVEGTAHGIEDLSPLRSCLEHITLSGSFTCPASISSLTSLTCLQMLLPAGQSVASSALQPLQQLQMLTLIPAPLTAALDGLTRLTSLALSYKTPLSAPVSLHSLTALKRLSLVFDFELDGEAAAAPINPMPPSLKDLTNLGELAIFVIEPTWCWSLPHLPCSLSYLKYGNCRLPAVTKPPGCLLQRLDIRMNREEDFLVEFDRCAQQFKEQLLELLVSCNNATLPASVCDLGRLVQLDISDSEVLMYVFPAAAITPGTSSGGGSNTSTGGGSSSGIGTATTSTRSNNGTGSISSIATIATSRGGSGTDTVITTSSCSGSNGAITSIGTGGNSGTGTIFTVSGCSSSSNAASTAVYSMLCLHKLRVLGCPMFLGVADTAERAASYTPNLQELTVRNCPALDVGQLGQLESLLPTLEIYASKL
jgi:hypothetical protein